MKKTKIAILIALLLCVSLGVFYVYKINVFDETTLKNIDVRTGDFSTPSVYTLDEKQAKTLFSSINSALETTEALPEDALAFDLTLLNKWDITKNYRVYFTDDHTIYMNIDNKSTLFKVEKPDFFYSHEGFDSYYSEQLFPNYALLIDEQQVAFSTQSSSWSFRRLDGSWHDITPPLRASDETIAEAVLSDSESTLGLDIGKMPSEATLKIYSSENKALVFEGKVNARQLPAPGYDGAFDYELNLNWNDETSGYRGEAVLTFKVNIDLPEAFTLSKSIVRQGDMLIVNAMYVNSADEIVLEQSIVPTFKWFSNGETLRGYIPTNYNTAVGKHALVFKNTRTGAVYTYEIEVVSRDFKVQKLTVDPNVEASTRNDAAYEEYRTIFNPVRTVSADTRYYTEDFLLPSPGKLTTEFGESRTVNGEPTSYRHNGIDIANKRGTDVLATNTGKVVLAYKLILTGNTVIIDHGEGLFSVYEHMDAMNVSQGDLVARGQKIGDMGSTGFSTGSHLHFMISYYDVNLEPGYFLYGESLTKENYSTLMK